MERTQPFFRLIKKSKTLEVWVPSQRIPATDYLTDEEYTIAEKLMTRDFKSALLYRRHPNKRIAMMANDIIEQKG